MILDSNLQLSDSQTVTGTAYSDDAIDSYALTQSSDLCLLIQVNKSAAAAGEATVAFQVVAAGESDLTGAKVISSTIGVSVSELTAGRKPLEIRIDPKAIGKLPASYSHVGVRYLVTGGPLTSGAFSAWLLNSKISTTQDYEMTYNIK
jgi:hypothetical protein